MRYKLRVRRRQQKSNNDDSVVVLRTSTLSVLERVRNCSFPEHNGSQHFEKEALPIVKEQRTIAKRPDKSNLEVFRVKQALSECRERLALLDSLDRLRTARLSQARQRGGLFPDAFDQAFNAQLNELRSMLRTQLTKLTVMDKQQHAGSPSEVELDQGGSNSVSSCCDHWPNLSSSWKRALFHAAKIPEGVPWRWARFYHQADFDFADFLRIRTLWDSYLVQSANAEQSSGDEPEKTPDSVLPNSWDLPVVQNVSPNWKAFIISESEIAECSTPSSE